MLSDEVVIGQAATPAGSFGAVFTSKGLARLTYPGEHVETLYSWAQRWAPGARHGADDARLGMLAEQLTAYLGGARRAFDLPLDLRGTAFQVEVWRVLQGIEYGQLRTYGQLAASLGRPQASRAVGAANGANPVPIIVPCHRVIGAHGRLVGYGGGLDLKRRLLELEGVLVPL